MNLLHADQEMSKQRFGTALSIGVSTAVAVGGGGTLNSTNCNHTTSGVQETIGRVT